MDFLYVTFQIMVEGITCTPCTIFGTAGFERIGASGIITPTVSAMTNYYLANDVTITGNVIWNHKTILIEPGVKITIGSAASLLIEHGHLYSCGMWEGFYLDNASENLFIHLNSLIEDANTAVYIHNPKTSAYTPIMGDDVLYCNDVIFNRNVRGIYIENYNQPDIWPYIFFNPSPFNIANTVFTSRDIEAVCPAYPTLWPTNNGANELKTPWASSDPFTLPMNIDNPSATLMGPYNRVACKNGAAAYCGIELQNIGLETASSTWAGGATIPSHYSQIIIGHDAVTANNDFQNLFDNMQVGIYANTSNVTCVNNAFAHMIPNSMITTGVTPPSGDGIYAISSGFPAQKRLQVISSPGSPYNNIFYGFTNGVECYNYYDVTCKNNFMINKVAPSVGGPWGMPAPATGLFGYRISSSHYNNIDISYNTVTNVSTGVGIWATVRPFGAMPMWGKQQFTGACNVSSNTIQAHPSGTSSITTEAVQMGISIQNVLSPYALGPWGATSIRYPSHVWLNSVTTDNNNIHDAYNGILVNNFFFQPAASRTNNIWMRSAPALRRRQIGINHTHNYKSTVFDNFVVGTDPSAWVRDSMRAYYAAANSKINVHCNIAENTGRGFEFYQANLGSGWYKNTMRETGKCMFLNYAVIGPQGGISFPTRNNWTPTGWWTGAKHQTYAFYSASTSSELWIDGGTLATNPINNYGFPLGLGYAPGTSLKTATTVLTTITCPIRVIHEEGWHSYESVSQQGISFVNNMLPGNWMAQFATWESLRVDSTLADSSLILQKFDSMAYTSRFALLASIEDYLWQGDKTSALALMSSGMDTVTNTTLDTITGVHLADELTVNPIVQNYMQFYGLYIKYADSALNNEDSLQIKALAQLCPVTNGTVVYQARALYSFIYNDDTAVYEDEGCVPDTNYYAERQLPTKESNVAQDGSGQQYRLHPNPSHGLINLLQGIVDEKPVHIELWNAVGVNIYKKDIVFIGGATQMRLTNVQPGLYLLKLTDSAGRKFILKFVEQ